ncbi:MAG: ACP S-malonyltransferase [Bacteroidales bacterium]|nr:ACP S-malonyltransferase [Bacteroidales bacterium]
MSDSTTVFVFPAFVRDYHEDKSFLAKGFSDYFYQQLTLASEIVDSDLSFFHPENQTFLDHELRTQYLAFIYGCSISNILQQRGILPNYLCGYSMGIYAALVQGGAISFENGLLLIRNAFQEISYTTMTGRFGMAGIVGLKKDDIKNILKSLPDVEIVNQNSIYSFVLSGNQQDLERAIELAREEGAFHARMLNVTVPYHSHLLKSPALQFAKFVYTLDIHSLKIPLVSVLNQETLHTREDIKTELVENLYKHFNWHATQEKMLSLGMTRFIECGPGKSLKKNAKFIEGTYQFLSMDEALK